MIQSNSAMWRQRFDLPKRGDEGMCSARWLFMACLLVSLVSLMCSSGVVFGEDSSSGDSSYGGSGSSLLTGSLVIPGSPTEAEQVKAQEEAKQSNPEVVAEREASQTEYEGLDGEQAEKVDGKSSPC
jgi:hypothetical protein